MNINLRLRLKSQFLTGLKALVKKTRRRYKLVMTKRKVLTAVLLSFVTTSSYALNESRTDQSEQDLRAVFERHHPRNDKSYRKLERLRPSDIAYKDYEGITRYAREPNDEGRWVKEVYVRSRGKDGRLDIVVFEYPRELQGADAGKAIVPGRYLFTRWSATMEADGIRRTLYMERAKLKILAEKPVGRRSASTFTTELKTASGIVTHQGDFLDTQTLEARKSFLGETAAQLRDLKLWNRPMDEWPIRYSLRTYLRPIVRALPNLLREVALRF